MVTGRERSVAGRYAIELVFRYHGPLCGHHSANQPRQLQQALLAEWAAGDPPGRLCVRLLGSAVRSSIL